MSTGWTIALVVAVAAGAGAVGFLWGNKHGFVRGELGFRQGNPNKGPTPVIDPKVAVAARVVSGLAPKPSKV
jgi:hypothetical protein